MRICVDCCVEKNDDQFYIAKGNRDGLMKRCKTCHMLRTSKWAKEHRDELNTMRRRKYIENPMPFLEQATKYRANHPEKNQENKRIHRARKYGSGGRHSASQWKEMLEQCGNKCVSCGRSDIRLTRDHIIPLTAGGSDNIANIQPLCQSCNSSKSNKHATDYRNGHEAAIVIQKTIRLLACPDCQQEFQTIHPMKRFCSVKCRIHWFNNRIQRNY